MLVRPKSRFSDWWITALRITALGLIVTGLSFGAKETYFTIGASQLLGTEVDADLKLAFLGFFNKSMDVVLLSSLEYTAMITITIWMARGGHSRATGSTFNDFALKDELTKPWKALASFCTRCRRFGWSWRSLLRCLLCLCISVCVMLQGLAINTIAIPKKRWYPNPNGYNGTSQDSDVQKAAAVEHPKAVLTAVDWYNLLGVGQANVGSESYPPWDWALALSAAYSIAGLTHTVSTVARPEKGWQEVYRMAQDGDAVKRWTGLNTAFESPHRYTETISADQGQILDMFEWLRKTGHEPTKSSMGWHGPLALVLPALHTSCKAANHTALGGTFNITIPQRNTSSDPTFSTYVGPLPDRNFSGATCLSTFRQGLFPVDMWVVDMGEPNLSFNNFGYENRWNKTVVYEPTIESDYAIVHSLAIQAHDSIPRMEQMVPSTGLLGQFLLMSRSLQKVDSKIQSDAAGLSIVLGVMLQNLLSTSNKYRSTLPLNLPLETKNKVVSYPMQWQLYGSSPRQSWEWVAVVVLVVVLLTFCFGFYQTIRYWMGPGFWVDLGGMMMLAQTSPRMQDIEDKKKAQRRLYLVAEDSTGKFVLESKIR